MSRRPHPHQPHAPSPPRNGVLKATAAQSFPAETRWLEIDRPWSSIIWWALVSTVVIVAIAFFPGGKDSFRIPKDSIFLTGTALCAALLACAFATGRARVTRRPDVLASLCAAGVLWTAIASLTSTNPMLSTRALWWVICSAVFFLLTWQLSFGRSLRFGLAVLIPALVNSLVVFLQWNHAPAPVRGAPGLETIGLLGNPSDVGSYLAIAIAPALFVFGRSKMSFTLGSAAFLFLGILLSHTFTATVTVAFLAVALLAMRWPRQVGLIGVIALGAILALALLNPAVIGQAREFVSQGGLDELLNYRVGSFLVSMNMFSSSPLVGVGPGTFGFNFLPHATEVLRAQTIRFSFLGDNYGEAHNDHLEVLAETGIPGYGICVGLALLLLRRGIQRAPDPGALMLIAVVVTATVLALAQFPFQLAATSSAILFLIGLSLGHATHR